MLHRDVTGPADACVAPVAWWKGEPAIIVRFTTWGCEMADGAPDSLEQRLERVYEQSSDDEREVLLALFQMAVAAGDQPVIGGDDGHAERDTAEVEGFTFRPPMTSQLHLQNRVDRYTRASATASNIMKKYSDTSKSVIQNMR